MNRYASAADLGIMLGSPPAPAARVTLANWHVPPWNRWGYLHTREILPTVGIARGSGPIWTFPRGTRLDLEPVHDFLAHSWTDALVVVSRGELVGEEYRNGMHEETRHLSMSVGKSITSLVVGALAGRDLIDTRALITGYIPELLGSACTGATVQHALDMQVAGGWEVVYPKDANEFSSLEAACGWIPAPPGWSTTLFEYMRATKSDGLHGVRVHYSCLNTDSLGLIAERVTGQRFSDVASEALWAPTGMEFDADLTVEPGGMAVADGGYCIAARDFARIGQLVLERGVAGGRRVIPEAWIDEYERPHPGPFATTSYGADWPGAAYHNQWWQMDGRLYAVGVHGQMIAVDRRTETVVVFLSSAPEPDNVSYALAQRSLVDTITRHLGHRA